MKSSITKTLNMKSKSLYVSGLRFFLGSIVTLPLLTLTACKVETPDGQIPKEYMGFVKVLEGRHDLCFNCGYGPNSSIKPENIPVDISFNDRTPSLSIGGNLGQALKDCHATIGKMKSISNDNHQTLSDNYIAEFHLDLGDCKSESRVNILGINVEGPRGKLMGVVWLDREDD